MYNFFINLNDLLKISLLILFYMSILLGVHTMARGWHPSFWCVVFRGWGRIKKGPIFIKNHSKRDILRQITVKHISLTFAKMIEHVHATYCHFITTIEM